MRRALLAAALVTTASLAGLFAAGCHNSSTEPSRTLALTGTITKGAIVSETVSMRHVGNLRMQLLDLQLIAPDGTATPSTVGVGVGIGVFANNSPSCTQTGAFGLAVGAEPLSLGLDRGSYCLNFTEAATLADGASLKYQVKVEITD